MQLLLDIAMATGPVMGYILQSRLILKNQSVGTFSTDICLVLLAANILRLNFYIFENYQLALLFQSIFMISAQLVLLNICCLYRESAKQPQAEDQESIYTFWRWKNFTPYWQSTLIFALVTFFVSIIMNMMDAKFYGEMIGLIALLTESMLIMPQIIEIIKQKDVEGISYGLIGLNLFGDTYKTFYFFFKKQAFQFKLCGIIQLVLDVVVISQIVFYRFNYRFTELPTEGTNQEKKKKQEEMKQYKRQQNNDELQGSLSHTIVIEEQIQNVQSKSQSQTDLQ